MPPQPSRSITVCTDPLPNVCVPARPRARDPAGARDDLGRRRGRAVDHDDHREAEARAAPVRLASSITRPSLPSVLTMSPSRRTSRRRGSLDPPARPGCGDVQHQPLEDASYPLPTARSSSFLQRRSRRPTANTRQFDVGDTIFEQLAPRRLHLVFRAPDLERQLAIARLDHQRHLAAAPGPACGATASSNSSAEDQDAVDALDDVARLNPGAARRANLESAR